MRLQRLVCQVPIRTLYPSLPLLPRIDDILLPDTFISELIREYWYAVRKEYKQVGWGRRHAKAVVWGRRHLGWSGWTSNIPSASLCLRCAPHG